ncbi:hypothetical protein F7R06_25160, partial [Pseudomonas moorei]
MHYCSPHGIKRRACRRSSTNARRNSRGTRRSPPKARSHIYGYPHFCNTVFDACLACFHLSGVWVATLRLDENRARRP